MLNRDLSDQKLMELKMYLRLARKAKNDKERHFALMLEVLLRTACRVDELCNIRVNDIDLVDKKINLRRPAKGSTKRSPDVELDVLSQILRECLAFGIAGEGSIVDLLNPGSLDTKKRMLERYWETLREKLFGKGFDLGLHCFRHTGARLVYEKTKDPRKVQLLLGHKSINSTMHYLQHITYSDVADLMFRII